MPSLTVLVIHNHYQQRGGEDSVFETECAMLRDAGHTVICYEKHNEEIGEQRLAASGQRLGGEKVSGFRVQEGEKGLAASGQRLGGEKGSGFRVQEKKTLSRASSLALSNQGYGLARQEDRNDSPAAPLEPSTYNLVPSPQLEPRTYHLAPFRSFWCFSWLKKLSLFRKTIWNRTTYREITALIREHRPDVVHCHNTFPLISPSVYWAAAKQGVPVVQTLHNYRLVCINPYLYRNGRICEACLGRSPLRGVIHRCYRGSLAASFTVAAMLMVHRLLGTYRNKVTTYIALTEFGRKKFLEARLCDPARVVVKPNAVAAPTGAEGSGFRVQDGKASSRALSRALSSPEQRLAASGQGPARQDDRNDSPATLEPRTYHLAPPSHTEAQSNRDVHQPTSHEQKSRTISFLCFSWLKKLLTPSPTQPTSPASTAEERIATKRHKNPQNETSSHTETQSNGGDQISCQSCNPVQNHAPSDSCSFVSIRGSSTPPTVLYVGRLSPEKGVDILIAAWKLLLEQGSGVRGQASETLSRALSQTLSNPEQELVGEEAEGSGVGVQEEAGRPCYASPHLVPTPSRLHLVDKLCRRGELRQRLSSLSKRIGLRGETKSVGPTPPYSHTPILPHPHTPTPPHSHALPQSPLNPEPFHLADDAQPRLHIIGDGPERAALEAAAADTPSIAFLGRLPHDQIASHMRSATALVLPTRCYEMFAITPLEAMQIGLPVILSKSAAMGSLVEDGETGYTFESGSAESLAVTLAKALADPARLAKMGRLAQARFLAGDCPPQRNVAALCRAYVRPLSGRTQMQEKL